MTEMEAPTLLTHDEAKVFIRELEKKTNATMRKLKANEHVTFHIHNSDHVTGRFTYNEVVNKVIVGRVVVGRGLKGEIKLVSEYAVTRQHLLADLNLADRVKVNKSERKWSKR
jgi:hypothetical protein